MVATREQDLRLEILNTLLTTPHRELAKIWPVHRDLIAKDPRFYVRLAAWYFDHGDVRDHKEMFVIALALSEFEGHRDVGLALLRSLPPYQVGRVVDFISGRQRTRKVRPEAPAKAKGKKQRRRSIREVLGLARAAATEQAPAAAVPVTVTERYGLFRNVPRSVKTEVVRYLREREADHDWFDGSVLSARKALKRLYALLHVRPSDRAQQILFDDDPPADSRLYQLRALATADSPAAQAAAIIKHRIPYRVAATVIRQMTPAVLLALIEQMSPQELINSMASLKRRGALDVPEIRTHVEAKLAEAQTAKRVSALKTDKAIEAAGATGALREALEDVADRQIKAKGRIARPTALLIDKSASMQEAIELGKQIGSMLSAICERELYAYAFDDMAYEIVPHGNDVADWERAMAGLRAGNCTSCGVSLVYLARKNRYVEQIILITDEGENTAPSFVTALQEYRAKLGANPSVCIVRTPKGSNQIERACRAAGIDVDVFQFTGDYYSLPNLVPLVSRPSKLELLMEIMDYPLPVRRSA